MPPKKITGQLRDRKDPTEELKELALNKNLSDEELAQSYTRNPERKAISHMMRYTRYDKSIELVYFFNKKYNKKQRRQIKVLDYGCSVADYGLSFGVYGYNVTLSDIEGGVIEFAKWRFKIRSIECETIPVKHDDLYPKFPVHDIIIAGEVLEHIRNPLITVRNFHEALPAGGYLWVSAYPYKEKKVGGGHLQEAADARLDVLKYMDGNFNRIDSHEGYLLQKK